MTEQRLEPGAAATLAHNTLSSQINALINCSTGPAKSMAESLLTLLDSNIGMVIEASNQQVDEINELIDTLEVRDTELAAARSEATRYALELKQLREGRRDDEKRVMDILAKHEQIKSQRDAYKRDADEVGAVRAEVKRLRNQAERHVEAKAKLEHELIKVRQKATDQRKHLLSITDCVQRCLQLMLFTRDTLIFEGLASEVIFESEGETYHIYRKPSEVAKYWQPLVEGKQISRAHQFMMRVETTSGYHYDVVPTEDGGLHIAKPRALPTGIKAYLKEQFATAQMFEFDQIKMRSDALTDKLDEISEILKPLSIISDQLGHQLIKEGIITNSTVNRNKNKRRAA